MKNTNLIKSLATVQGGTEDTLHPLSALTLGVVDKAGRLRVRTNDDGNLVITDPDTSYTTTLAFTEPTANRTITFPDETFSLGGATVEARTATADGTTTGTISAGTTHVTVTSDDANKIIILPAPEVGLTIVLVNGATGYELRSSTPASIAINGGTGASAESAIPASSTIVALCVSATSWKVVRWDAPVTAATVGSDIAAFGAASVGTDIAAFGAATAATLTGTLTGTTNGALVDVAATAASTAGGATPSATDVDTGIATAVASIVTGVNEQNKELLEMVNKLTADNAAQLTELGTLRTFVNAVKADNAAQLTELGTLRTFVNALKADIATLRTNGSVEAAA